jgi:transcriptional regulator with XRE-family HTH domain
MTGPERLLYLMREEHITPYYLSRKLGVNQSQIKNWTDGKGISQKNLQRLSDFFGVPVGYFFGEGDDVIRPYERMKAIGKRRNLVVDAALSTRYQPQQIHEIQVQAEDEVNDTENPAELNTMFEILRNIEVTEDLRADNIVTLPQANELLHYLLKGENGVIDPVILKEKQEAFVNAARKLLGV